jgi:16S rRNA (uracil1498-N3)-methyltransferase
VADLVALDRLLAQWPEGRRLYWCDEKAAGQPATLSPATGPAAILIGPEGGFSAEEATRLRARPDTVPLSLGPRILRADTAAVAAITLWQSTCGDWR